MAPNDEFIREVDDEYRRDRVAQMWKRYNGLIIGGVLVDVGAGGGWRYWEHVQETARAGAAAARFEEALRLSRDEKSDEAKPVFEALAKEADGRLHVCWPLPPCGRTRASAMPRTARRPTTLSQPTRDRLRSGRISRAYAPRAAPRHGGSEASCARRSRGWPSPTNPWRHSARELLGLSGPKAGDMDFAGSWFDQIAADRETPAVPAAASCRLYCARRRWPVQVTQ